VAYRVEIKKGNLLDEKSATFILNPSNTRLNLGGGVSMAFRLHFGNTLQDLMNEKLNEVGHLSKGDVVLTPLNNNSSFKNILHAAVMDYNPGVCGIESFPTLKDIKAALYNIEIYLKEWADKNKDEELKLVVPLMGCGVGRQNKEDVINLYKEFFQREVDFECKVVIYGYSSEDYRLIDSIFNQS